MTIPEPVVAPRPIPEVLFTEAQVAILPQLGPELALGPERPLLSVFRLESHRSSQVVSNILAHAILDRATGAVTTSAELAAIGGGATANVVVDTRTGTHTISALATDAPASGAGPIRNPGYAAFLLTPASLLTSRLVLSPERINGTLLGDVFAIDHHPGDPTWAKTGSVAVVGILGTVLGFALLDPPPEAAVGAQQRRREGATTETGDDLLRLLVAGTGSLPRLLAGHRPVMLGVAGLPAETSHSRIAYRKAARMAAPEWRDLIAALVATDHQDQAS